MATSGTMTVLPGSPDTPSTVEIVTAGLDDTRSIEFLVNGIVRGTIPVSLAGEALLTYIVPAGPIRNALADLNSAGGNAKALDGVLCSVGDGSNSMELRYLAV